MDTLITSFVNDQEDEAVVHLIMSDVKMRISKFYKEAKHAFQHLEKTSKQCCALPDNLATDDRRAITDAIENYEPAAINIFNKLNSNDTAFDQKGLAFTTVKKLWVGMIPQVKFFHECLRRKIENRIDNLAEDEVTSTKTFVQILDSN